MIAKQKAIVHPWHRRVRDGQEVYIRTVELSLPDSDVTAQVYIQCNPDAAVEEVEKDARMKLLIATLRDARGEREIRNEAS